MPATWLKPWLLATGRGERITKHDLLLEAAADLRGKHRDERPVRDD
jgi:hypothetical protein